MRTIDRQYPKPDGRKLSPVKNMGLFREVFEAGLTEALYGTQMRWEMEAREARLRRSLEHTRTGSG